MNLLSAVGVGDFLDRALKLMAKGGAERRHGALRAPILHRVDLEVHGVGGGIR
ncbi:MAG TPA: hypothetical protein VM241_05090 [Candidatus Thermoplasmatota archaeon]|nr:hypothetical protein [Candidatus Thermoplasmatota archaeon]